jgi:hypothetical protein
MTLSSDRFAEMTAPLAALRGGPDGGTGPFDLAVFGISVPGEEGVVAGFADAGATWWLESLSPMRGDVEHLLEVIGAGPPRPH